MEVNKNTAYKNKTASYKDEWETPGWLFNLLNARFHFTVDAAATEDNCKINLSDGSQWFFTDGLKSSWKYERIFCNPPFSEKDKWIKKAHNEVLYGKCPLCVMILPASIENMAYHKYIFNKFYWEPLEGRVSFIDPETKRPKPGNTHGTIIVYFWKPIKK